MTEFTDEFVDKIALSCIQFYDTIPKIGKAITGEWTVLSCIVQLDTITKRFEIVSLGTGLKCIGASKMSPEGIVINDSHAEVFARRGFMLYIYDHLEKAVLPSPHCQSIFKKEEGRFRMRENLEFIFYSSQMPCGDASIMPKSDIEDYGNLISSLKRETKDDNGLECKKSKINKDIHRTGAKCLPHNEQDPKGTGLKYHLLGKVRTKPGRGDRTLSVSCSDKMARWIHVGIQGALLDMLLSEPIFIKHFIFGSGVPYSKESLTRALLKRNLDGDNDFKIPVIPKIYHSAVTFHRIKSETRLQPAHTSVVFVNGVTEVGVKGKRLGVTNKNARLKSSSLSISKYSFYRRFLYLLEKDPKLGERVAEGSKIDSIPYNVMKKKSKQYYDNWKKVKDGFFKTWTVKPDMWSFCITPEFYAEGYL